MLIGFMLPLLPTPFMIPSETPASATLTPGSALAAEVPPAAEPQEAEDDPWNAAWTSQQQFLDDIAEVAENLRKTLPSLTKNLNAAVAPFEHETQRLFVLSSTYGKNPRVLEAVRQRIIDTGAALREAMAPATAARAAARDMLAKVSQLEKTLPADARSNVALSKSLRAYADTVAQVKKRLAGIADRLDAALTQGELLLEKSRAAAEKIDAQLPKLWRGQYLMPPVRYLDAAGWTELSAHIAGMFADITLRMSMEIPQTWDAWGAAAMRFLTMLLFGGLLATVAWRKLPVRQTAESFPHVFKTSVPWLLTGIALLAAATAGGGDNIYRGLLSLGNVLLIIGQISLAWDLRRISTRDLPQRSPYWSLCAPTLAGYILMYPDLPANLLALSWALVLAAALLWRRFRRSALPPLQMESAFLRMDAAALWLSLFMTVLGLPRYSILFYLLFVTIAVALQLSVGGLRLVHVASGHLPQEGARAVIGSLLIACAAPVILILVAMAVTLWIITLPGGVYLVRHYAVTGVSVGETHFSVLQLLLIISGFYLTRAAVVLGGGLLSNLPKHGFTIDKTLIPPLRTAFTYALWALFGALALKALGMELSSLAVVAGGLSVGIGFGMQNIVNNFLSGMILIFSRVLQEGDVIDVGGLNGVVRKISVRATTVETYDNAVIYVPNAEFVSNRLINWTRNSRSVRREITVGVAYGANPEFVMRLLRQVAEANPDVLNYPPPAVIFAEFGNSTLDFTLRFWVHDYDKGVPTASDLRVEIEKTFRAHNVEVAFPQLDVHIKDMPHAPAAPRVLSKTDNAPTRGPARRLVRPFRKMRRGRPADLP